MYSRFSVHIISEIKQSKMKKPIPIGQSPVISLPEVDLQQTYNNVTPVSHIHGTFIRLIEEMAAGSETMQLSCHQSSNEFMYTICHENVIATFHVQDLNMSITKEGGQS